MDYISVQDLAGQLGIDRSNLRKFILGIGIKPHRRRLPGTRGQLCLVLTSEEAETVTRVRRGLGYGGGEGLKVVPSESGSFYVIQLIPELDPRRVKFGFAENVETRLSQHRTSAPTATVLKSWPCKRSWESTIIDAMSPLCRHILNEVFECDNLVALCSRADNLFSLLPDPSLKFGLSDYSPLKNQKGAKVLATAEYSALPKDEQQKHNLLASHFGVLASITSAEGQKKLEKVVANADGKLPLAISLEAFK